MFVQRLAEKVDRGCINIVEINRPDSSADRTTLLINLVVANHGCLQSAQGCFYIAQGCLWLAQGCLMFVLAIVFATAEIVLDMCSSEYHSACRGDNSFTRQA